MSKDVVFDREYEAYEYLALALIGIGIVCCRQGLSGSGSFLTIVALFMALIVMCVRWYLTRRSL